MLSKEAQWLLKEKYDGAKSEGFHDDLARLESGEPLAYVIGHIPFLGTTIHLDGRPLIPRVETEYWVSQAIHVFKGSPIASAKVLDLCAGSGCIGVAFAHAIADCIIHFAEIDTSLHSLIARNCVSNGVEEDRMRIFGGDLFDSITETYDLILSNPPYLPLDSIHVAESVKRYEPERALYGGDDGLSYIRTILAQVRTHLAPHGLLYIEHEPDQKEAISTLAAQHGLSATTHTDQFKTPRYSTIAVAQ